MIQDKVLKTLEFDKIIEKVSSFAVLATSKRRLLEDEFDLSYQNAKYLLDKTNEAYNLYIEGVKGVVYFDEIFDELNLAEKLSTLSADGSLRILKISRAASFSGFTAIERFRC